MGIKNAVNKRFIEAVEHLTDGDSHVNKKQLASKIGIGASKLSEILNDRMNAGVDVISELCKNFSINPDWILMGIGEMILSSQSTSTVEEPVSVYKTNLPKIITVDNTGNENILLVPVTARAGYLTGYGDAEFLDTLPAYRMPKLSNGTFRMFEVEGHSMYPTIHQGSIAIGEWVEDWKDIKDNQIYVIVTREDGIVIKRVLNRIEKYGTLYLKSDNRKEYPSYTISPKDIVEVWHLKTALVFEFQDPATLYDRVNDLEAEIGFLKSRIK